MSAKPYKSNTLNELKVELKELAKKIRKSKFLFKHGQRTRDFKPFEEFAGNGCGEYILQDLSYEFRYKHIAYCISRGTSLERIEGEDATLDHNMEKYLSELKIKIQEDMNRINCEKYIDAIDKELS